MIYKLLRPEEWSELRTGAPFKGSPDDLADGFIHFSSAAQTRETAQKHFAGVAGLVLAEIDPDLLPRPLRWEPSRGGTLFPHLYAHLPSAAVTRSWTLLLGPGGRHVFPDELLIDPA